MYKIGVFPEFRDQYRLSAGNTPTGAEIASCASGTVISELLRKKATILENAECHLSEDEIETGNLSRVACNTCDTVIIKDVDQRIEWVNGSFSRNYGYSLEACRGQYVKDLIGHDEVVLGDATLNHVAGSSTRRRSEVLRCAKDGSKRWLALECRPITDDSGEVTGFIEIEKDITERKQAEADLLEERRAAAAAIKAKSEFLATVCHEIRNPVNVMIGMMDLALQTNLTAEQRDYLNLMKTSSGVLSRVVNDLLDLVRIESGQLEAEQVSFSLRESMGNTLQMFALDAQRKGLALAYDIAPDVPDALLGDPMRLGQIVINLLANAIKFTERGEVVLRVEREIKADKNRGNSEVTCRFSIRDSGIGIAKEKQESIFKPFLQAEISTARLYGGSGLGLSIAARLVELMKGRLWLESAPGKGSTFFFTARFCRPTASILPKSAPIDFKGLSALLVVSHPVNRRFLANTLGRWNIGVREVENAGAAWACLKQADAAQKPYRFVLLDDALADIDSETMAAHFCKNHALSCESVLILGSSFGRKARANLDNAVNFTRLAMPLKPSELLAAITAKTGPLTENAFRSALTPATEPEAIPPLNLEVLLVDDSLISRRFSQILLEKMGCRVLLADDGMAALALLERKPPDLILMDMHMPKMNGIQTTAAIRLKEQQTGRHLPVIALTAHIGERDWEPCRQAGMDACLSKPIQPASLLDIVRQVSTVQKQHRLTALLGNPVLDRPALLARVNEDKALLSEIGRLFLRSCSKLMGGARSAIAQHDAEALAQTLHTLLGLFCSLSANTAQEITEKLERLSLIEQPEQVAQAYRQLKSAVKALKAELAHLIQEVPTDQRPHAGEAWLEAISSKSKIHSASTALHDRKPSSSTGSLRPIAMNRSKPPVVQASGWPHKNSGSL